MRPKTASSYQERLNRVLVHIQEHLEEPLTLGGLAQVACLSPFHFHRIFSAHLGETVAEYVHRLRLERAAMKLAFTGERVTDTALGAGYETPATFTRAFRGRFGVSPSEFRGLRRETVKLPAEKTIKKELVVTKPEMREFPEARVMFVRRTGAYGEAAAAAWQALCGFVYGQRLMNKDTLMIGIGRDVPEITPEDKLRYDACVTFTGDMGTEGEVGQQIIAGGHHAVFLHKGAYAGLSEAYRYIYADWLATSGLALRDQPSFEVYLNRDPARTKPENLRSEIWLPVE